MLPVKVKKRYIEARSAALRSHRLRVSKDLRLIEKKLRALVKPAEVKRWIAARNAMLEGRTPVEAILQGDTNRVLELLAQLEEGIYA